MLAQFGAKRVDVDRTARERSIFSTRWTYIAAALSVLLSGCASFSGDGGMTAVANITGETVQKDVVAIRTPDDEQRANERVKRLLARPLTVNSAVQIALLNNKGLQASYNELALAETDLVQEGLPPNPTFSILRLSGNGALEIERQVVGDILALATLPFRTEIARTRFRKAQLRAAEDTLRLAAEVRRAYYRAVAANELAVLLTDAKSTADAAAQLAVKLAETGSINKLDQAREQVFSVETATELATARQNSASARERLIRLLGLWDNNGLRLPNMMPKLPDRPLQLPSIEVAAVEHRIDLQIARIELDALAQSLSLTEASRFVTLLDISGIDKKTRDVGGATFHERGYDMQFQVPIFDGGEVRVRQAIEIYNQAFNRLTEKAVNVRSEARDAYRVYRSTYDIAARYQRDVLPLRKIISDEMQLRFSSMQIDVFSLLTEARQRLTSLRAAIDARRNFWLAAAELNTAINGGGVSETATSSPASTTADASGN